MTSGQQFLLSITIIVGIADLLISGFFARRNYRKNPQRKNTSRIAMSVITFLVLFCAIALLYLPVFAVLGFMTYDRAAEAEIQMTQAAMQSMTLLLQMQLQ